MNQLFIAKLVFGLHFRSFTLLTTEFLMSFLHAKLFHREYRWPKCIWYSPRYDTTCDGSPVRCGTTAETYTTGHRNLHADVL